MSYVFKVSKYVTKAITANAYKNDGATVVYGGNVVSGDRVVTNTLGRTVVGYHTSRHGSKVPSPRSNAQIAAGATIPTFKPLSSGNFAQQTKGRYIIRGYTAYLANVATNVLTYGSHLVARRSIHKNERLRTTFVSAFSWTAPTGNNASNNPQSTTTYSYTESNQNSLAYSPNTDGFDGNDNAARPTRAIPGELVMLTGSPTPSQLDYPEKTG